MWVTPGWAEAGAAVIGRARERRGVSMAGDALHAGVSAERVVVPMPGTGCEEARLSFDNGVERLQLRADQALRASPPSARTSVDMICTVLPAPLGPSGENVVPAPTSRSMPSRTAVSPNDLRSPVAVVALVMLLPFAITVARSAAITSRVHAAGFIAVSRRFHSLARVLGDPYRTNSGTTPSASSMACGRLTHMASCPSACRQRRGPAAGLRPDARDCHRSRITPNGSHW